jgi:hypothetical protein
MAEASSRFQATVNVDPAYLTREDVLREINSLRELFDSRLNGITARLDAMDKAVELLDKHVSIVPSETDIKVGQLHAVVDEMFQTQGQRFTTVDEKFKGIETQFEERDVRVKDQAISATTAVNAALQAQKEQAFSQTESLTKSIEKSERSTHEQIAQQGQLLQSSVSSLNDKIGALDLRVTRFESLGLGTAAANEAQRANHSVATQDSSHNLAVTTAVLGAVFGLVGVVSTIIAIASRLR